VQRLSAWRRDGPVTLDKADQAPGPNQFVNLGPVDPEEQLCAGELVVIDAPHHSAAHILDRDRPLL
ncbi:hypothetical protein NX784_28665, partial [Massilia pinisoli]